MTEVLLIDHRDSFVFNLAERFERVGAKVRVFRSGLAAERVLELAEAGGERRLIALSPGPGRPEDEPETLRLITQAKGRVPVLGVCLGHQAILHEAGAKVERAAQPVHGKIQRLSHDAQGPFTGLPSPLAITRYHSLGVREAPPRFTVHARLDGLTMAVSDPHAMQAGLQFHPESIGTPDGDAMLAWALTGLGAASGAWSGAAEGR